MTTVQIKTKLGKDRMIHVPAPVEFAVGDSVEVVVVLQLVPAEPYDERQEIGRSKASPERAS
jgi:hypothetical protein